MVLPEAGCKSREVQVGVPTSFGIRDIHSNMILIYDRDDGFLNSTEKQSGNPCKPVRSPENNGTPKVDDPSRYPALK